MENQKMKIEKKPSILADKTTEQIKKGAIIIRREDTGEILFEDHNIITNTVKYLFARLMANFSPGDVNVPFTQGHEPLYGVWGLALGTGSPNWAPQTQPVETPTQTALITPVLRKPLGQISFVDQSFNPVSEFTLQVNFQTTINATTDGLIGVGIREMGLIGGGTNVGGPTNMVTAPFFNPQDVSGPGGGPSMNSVVLVNYKTLPPLVLPGGVNVIFSWILSF